MKKLFLCASLLTLFEGSLNAITLKNESDMPIEMEVYLDKEILLKPLSKGESYSYSLEAQDLKNARQKNYQLSVSALWDAKLPQFCDDIDLKKYENRAVNEMAFVFTENHSCKVELPRGEAVN